MSDNLKKGAVIALGYFDSVHKGHRKVILCAKKFAKVHDCDLVVFTFKGNLKEAINGDGDKCVYLFKEREKLLTDLGVDQIYFAPVDQKFLSKSRTLFLSDLLRKFKVKCFVCGKDYRFGKFGKGDVNYLKSYCLKRGIEVVVVDDFNFSGEKVSTTAIKKLLSLGQIEKANALLGQDYSVTGKVFSDRKVGTTIGFPTVNIKIDKDKFAIKDGVYSGTVSIDGLEYRALINYGARPTFDLSEKLIEAHLIDFSGDLYGKELTLTFTRRLRDVMKFIDKESLKKQIELDLKSIKENQ